jgi:hypothetical protein
MEGVAVGYNFEMGLSTDYPSQIWFSGCREENLNVIFYQNIPNLHNRYKSANQNSSNFNCTYMAMSSLAYIPSFSVIFFSFSRFIPIMQIRYILIKDHI